MSDTTILLPSKPRIVSEENNRGIYEIDGLYPGYGHTLGNSLRRIILSSIRGAAITKIKIDGASHEFSTIEGVKEDTILILLNLKKVRFALSGDEPQTATLSAKGITTVTAGDFKTSGQLEILNGDEYIAELTAKNASLSIEVTVEKGSGFVPKDQHDKEKNDVGTIAVDALFSPIRRVSYEVENMRVGDKTNHNRLRFLIETDGSISPKSALENSIKIMIEQLQAMLEFKVAIPNLRYEDTSVVEAHATIREDDSKEDVNKEELAELMKTRIDTLDLSTRTQNALQTANIRTLGGIARKKTDDLLELEGIGEKGIQEIKKALATFGLSLK
jgi:DNA-directed RNA polymerase subunit alpha